MHRQSKMTASGRVSSQVPNISAAPTPAAPPALPPSIWTGRERFTPKRYQGLNRPRKGGNPDVGLTVQPDSPKQGPNSGGLAKDLALV